MFGFLSCFNYNVYNTHPELFSSKHYFEFIHLTHRHIRHLYSIFSQIPHRGDRAQLKELFVYFDIDHSLFSKRVLASGISAKGISFVEFVMCVWNYCTSDESTLVDLCFRLYLPNTLDYESEIRGRDVTQLLADLYGGDYLLKHPQLASVHNTLASMQDVPFTLEHFAEFCECHHLLAPARVAQQRLRGITAGALGAAAWARACRARKAIEVDFAFKDDFKLKLTDIERCLDLPCRPPPERRSSTSNHSRGSDSLTAIVQSKREKDPQRSQEQGRGDEAESRSRRSRPRSPGDHPSLRRRRRSANEGRDLNRLTKVALQKGLAPTEHEMHHFKRDVLSVLGEKREKPSKSSGRRHSFSSSRVHPGGGGADDEVMSPGSDNNRSGSNNNSSGRAAPGRAKRRGKFSRRLTY